MSDTLHGTASVDSGGVPVLGHAVLGAVSTVVGGLETLRYSGDKISPSDRALLEAAIERNLAKITDAARSLMTGDAITISLR